MATKPVNAQDGIALLSGAIFNYMDPDACEVTIEDLATALSNICRFSGHVPQFYSVAQHAVNVSLIVPDEHAFTALMHDTAEGFTNDLPSPLKWCFPDFKKLEERIEASISRKFGFQYPLPPEVKVADLQMLKIEKEHVKQDTNHWGMLDGVETDELVSKVFLQPMIPQVARQFFLARYRFLTGQELDVQADVLSLRQIFMDRLARGEKPFVAWGNYDEKTQRTWLQTGNC